MRTNTRHQLRDWLCGVALIVTGIAAIVAIGLAAESYWNKLQPRPEPDTRRIGSWTVFQSPYTGLCYEALTTWGNDVSLGAQVDCATNPPEEIRPWR